MADSEKPKPPPMRTERRGITLPVFIILTLCVIILGVAAGFLFQVPQ